MIDATKRFAVINETHKIICIVMQEASDALSKTADSETVSTYQVSSVQLVTDKKLEAFNKAFLLFARFFHYPTQILDMVFSSSTFTKSSLLLWQF